MMRDAQLAGWPRPPAMGFRPAWADVRPAAISRC